MTSKNNWRYKGLVYWKGEDTKRPELLGHDVLTGEYEYVDICDAVAMYGDVYYCTLTLETRMVNERPHGFWSQAPHFEGAVPR